MAPLTSGNLTGPSTAYSDPVRVMKDSDSPWAMDLNTSVTIVLGVLSLILQAWQICYGPRHITRLATVQDGPVRGSEITADIPDSPMPPAQRERTRQSAGRGGSARSFHLQPRPSLREPPSRPAGQDRGADGYDWRAPPGNFRRRSSSQFSGTGQRGGGIGMSGRGRHRSQYSNGWSAPNTMGSLYEN